MKRMATWIALMACVLAAGLVMGDEVEPPELSGAQWRQIGIEIMLGAVAVSIIGGVLVHWLVKKGRGRADKR